MRDCKTCRHWDRNPALDADRMGVCKLASVGHDPRFSGGGDDVTTRDDFGCVAHQPGDEDA